MDRAGARGALEPQDGAPVPRHDVGRREGAPELLGRELAGEGPLDLPVALGILRRHEERVQPLEEPRIARAVVELGVGVPFGVEDERAAGCI
jgi:hypothetical protein